MNSRCPEVLKAWLSFLERRRFIEDEGTSYTKSVRSHLMNFPCIFAYLQIIQRDGSILLLLFNNSFTDSLRALIKTPLVRGRKISIINKKHMGGMTSI